MKRVAGDGKKGAKEGVRRPIPHFQAPVIIGKKSGQLCFDRLNGREENSKSKENKVAPCVRSLSAPASITQQPPVPLTLYPLALSFSLFP